VNAVAGQFPGAESAAGAVGPGVLRLGTRRSGDDRCERVIREGSQATAASVARIEVTGAPVGDREPAAELVDDLLAIVMVFAARMYGVRAAKVRRHDRDVLVAEAAAGAGVR